MSPARRAADLDRLARGLPGQVVCEGDPAWHGARRCWNLAVEQRPRAVVFPESAEAVAATVRFAAAHDYRISFQGGGHNAGPIVWSERQLLLRTDRLRTIEVDAGRAVARVEAGVLSDELTFAASAHGLTFLAGTSPDVGVIGYTIGGGLSWMVRRHGLAANTVVAADLVLADGTHVRADARREPDLFWAIRGGGGSFGAVIALELALFPARALYAGSLFWPIERATEVLSAWLDWLGGVPDACTSLGRLLRLPDEDGLPPHLRGRSFAMVELAVVGDERYGAALVEPLRRLGPAFDTVAMTPVADLSAINMDPHAPVPYCGDGICLDGFDAGAVAALVDAFGESVLAHAEVRHLGGAAAASSPDHGALDAIDAPFVTFSFGLAANEHARHAVGADLEALHASLAPWNSGRRYLNFTESPTESGLLFSERSFERLCAVRERFDPTRLFRPNHPVGAGDGDRDAS